MKITIQRTESKEIEIITPAYYRLSSKEVLAIFDEKNVFIAFRIDGMTTIVSKEFDYLSDSDREKLTDENIISETEFFEAYNKAHAALSLLPKYSESDEIENGFQDQEDWTEKMNDHAETELLNFDK